jgi:hypothetical protein
LHRGSSVDADTLSRRPGAAEAADLGVHRLVLLPSSMDGTVIDDLIASVGDNLVGRI